MKEKLKRQYCYVFLTCEKEQEKEIAKLLLTKRLVACVKFMPVNASFWWQGAIANGDETLLVMESAEDLFETIEAEVAKVHAYETFVLTCVPMKKINRQAQEWLEGELT